MTQDTTTSTRNERIALAARWYQEGAPVWTVKPLDSEEIIVSIIERIDADKLSALRQREAIWGAEDLDGQASAHATEVTGYTWSFAEMLSDDAEAYEAIRKLELARLRAERSERIVLALADCLR